MKINNRNILTNISFKIKESENKYNSEILNNKNVFSFIKDNISISKNFNKNFEFNTIDTKLSVGNIKGNINGYDTEKSFINAVIDLNKTNINKDFVILEKNNKYFIYELKTNKLFDNDLEYYSDLKVSRDKISIPKDTKLIALCSDKNSIRFFNNDNTDNNLYERIENPKEDENLESLEKKLNAVLNRLDKMEKTLTPSKDHKGLFTSMYKVITNRALEEMKNYIKDGKNEEAKFEAKLAINFANKYFEAYDNLIKGDIEKIPDAWRYAFDSGRISQAENYPNESIIEILALSMNAHILHDLPLTLKEVGFNPKDKIMNDTFDHFNKALYEEKNNIIKAITKNYGKKLENFDEMTSKVDMVLNGFSLKKHEPITQNLFTSMRTIAKNSSQNMNEKDIKEFSSKTANSIISFIPGGNNEKLSLRDNISIFLNENVKKLFNK